MVWYGAFMELIEVNLGPLVTDDVNRAQTSGNVYHLATSIFNIGRHYLGEERTLASVFRTIRTTRALRR